MYKKTHPVHSISKAIAYLLSLLLLSLCCLFIAACSDNEVYTITFETNGASAVNPITVNKGSKTTKPTDPVHSTKLGKEVDAWCSDKALTQAFDFNAPITANITLYAKWSRYSKVQKASGGSYDKTEFVKDDETNLIWEGKTDDGGLRDKDNTYDHYANPDNPTGASLYVINVNNSQLGGFNDWRLPTKEELLTLS